MSQSNDDLVSVRVFGRQTVTFSVTRKIKRELWEHIKDRIDDTDSDYLLDELGVAVSDHIVDAEPVEDLEVEEGTDDNNADDPEADEGDDEEAEDSDG